jgi:hypothetical protein
LDAFFRSPDIALLLIDELLNAANSVSVTVLMRVARPDA